MQIHKKCHENVWIISGTSDGPILANKLIRSNFSVFVSVISYRASEVYPKDNKLHIFTGKLLNKDEIKKIIVDHDIDHVVDATHPFALQISQYLKKACHECQRTLLRFERNLDKKSKAKPIFISNLKDIKTNLKNRNLLLAIGSRLLDNTAQHYIDLGVNVFARIISTPESIINAFSSRIKKSNIAILNPSKIYKNNLEAELCKYWEIDYILCRESGGYSQTNWERICISYGLGLFLLKRPEVKNKFTYSGYDELVNSIINKEYRNIHK